MYDPSEHVDISNFIHVRGAREHNLQNISTKIPKNKLVVITGLSGSGKSSLAFDTIYAEGQRRYVESLSTYARQFLDQQKKPEVDSIEGLSPAISIEQRGVNRNPRSTVGTITEIYDFLRLLYAKVARPHSPTTGKELTPQSSSQVVNQIAEMPKKSKIMILAPVVINRKGLHKTELQSAQKMGFSDAFIDGVIVDLEKDISLDKNKRHSISIIIDKIIITGLVDSRLASSVDKALEISSGLVSVYDLGTKKTKAFYTSFYCPDSGVSFPKPEPVCSPLTAPWGPAKTVMVWAIKHYSTQI